MEGNITTTALENGGAVRGDIHAGGHIRLSEKSQVSGDITAASISVDQGAVIQGCVMIGTRGTPATLSPGFREVTPSPASSTVPENSWPSTFGKK